MGNLKYKNALVAEIERILLNYTKRYDELVKYEVWITAKEIENRIEALKEVLSIIDTIEVKDSYEQCVQYDSIKAAIQAHAETYSFNIESKLFNQLTKEQQKLWRKEIEQACISGGDAGYLLARDPRYKENLEVKEVDFEKEIDKFYGMYRKNGITFSTEDNEECLDWKVDCNPNFEIAFAKHFFELGLKVQKGEFLDTLEVSYNLTFF